MRNPGGHFLALGRPGLLAWACLGGHSHQVPVNAEEINQLRERAGELTEVGRHRRLGLALLQFSGLHIQQPADIQAAQIALGQLGAKRQKGR